MGIGKQSQKPTFFEMWGQQRKGGMTYTVLLIGGCTFILLLFVQLIYQMVKQDFSSFAFHPSFLLIAIAAGVVYWLINERRYKKLLAQQEKGGQSRKDAENP